MKTADNLMPNSLVSDASCYCSHVSLTTFLRRHRILTDFDKFRSVNRQLVEQGKVKLDDPVEDVLPEIKEIKMLDGSEPKNKITLRMLVSLSSA